MDINQLKALLLTFWLENFNPENNGFAALDIQEVSDKMIKPIYILLTENEMNFTFSAKDILIQETNFQLFNIENYIITERYVNQNASGGSFYTYLKARISSNNLPEISFQLGFDLSLQDKDTTIHLAATLTYIIKAFIDDCRTRNILGIHFCLQEIQFHPIDNKPYRYYDCMKRLLENFYAQT